MADGNADPGGSTPKTDLVVDFDDPLYIHPFDNSVSTIINFKLLGTENYRVWRSSMTRGLKARNKLGFADGTITKPKDDSSKILKWERANAVTSSWILGSISESIYAGHAGLNFMKLIIRLMDPLFLMFIKNQFSHSIWSFSV